MKAIVKYGEAAGQVDYRDIPEPLCGLHDVKIEIKACAICITDLHIVAGSYPWSVGTPLGHEFCGIVVETGAEVSDFRVGDRVVACMDGGFAKYVVKDESDWVFHLPDNISYEEGALLEPLSAAANSVINNSHIKPQDVVLIEGPGVMGLFALQIAKLVGAVVIITGTDSDRERLQLAHRLGADYALNIQKENLEELVGAVTHGKGVDIVIECSGNQAALDKGIQVLKTEGQLTQVGIFGKPAVLDMGHLVYYKKKIIGSIAYDRETWLRTIGMVSEGKVDVKSFITAKLPLDEWEKGYKMAENKEGLRIILVP